MAGSASGDFDNGDYVQQFVTTEIVSPEQNRPPTYVHSSARVNSQIPRTDHPLAVGSASQGIMRVGTRLPEEEGLSESWRRMAAFSSFINSTDSPAVAGFTPDHSDVPVQAFAGPSNMNDQNGGWRVQPAVGTNNVNTFLEPGSTGFTYNAAGFPPGAGVARTVTPGPSCGHM